jgi:uncharacterized protein YjbI with pentapeptide repeats
LKELIFRGLIFMELIFKGLTFRELTSIGLTFKKLTKESNLEGTNFDGAYLVVTNLEGAKNLSLFQLSKARTLSNAKLDNELLMSLKEKFPTLFEEPK